MIGLRFKDAKSIFFDRKAVTGAVDKATRKVLSKFGAFVRQNARSSIRRRRRVSRPGEPPSSHVGLLRRFIFFGYDAGRRSVVIGPTLLNARSGYGSVKVPEVLECGASVIGKRRGVRRRMRYEARPFMGPAYRKELPGLPAMWRDSVK